MLAHALRSTHWALWLVDNVDERLALADEIVQLAERAGDRALTFEGHAFRLWDFCELADVAGSERELALCERLGGELQQPYYRWLLALIRTFLAAAKGRPADVERLAQETLQLGQEAQNTNAALGFAVQMMLPLREQGRNAELEPFLLGLDLYPLIAPALRCGRVVFYAEQGREAEARGELADLIAGIATWSRNFTWLFSVTYVSEACALLRDVERAPKLYDMLRPFAAHYMTIGPVLPIGSVSRQLGMLAALLGRSEEAVQHFEAALAMDGRVGTKHMVARTQTEYAALLLARGAPGDRAKGLDLLNRALDTGRELGMKPLVEKALALKLRAQGVDTGNFKTSIDGVVAVVQREPPDLRRHAAPDGTVSILFSDIEGSTAMTERLGDQRWLELLRAHNAIVREQVARHGGFEVKSQGDGFMVAFQSARRALHCAIGMQQALATYSQQHPVDAFRVRIGLHAGETIREADDFFGKNVILAARIAAHAQGGEILVSALVRELTHSAGDIGFGAMREAELKGLSGSHTLYSVEWMG